MQQLAGRIGRLLGKRSAERARRMRDG